MRISVDKDMYLYLETDFEKIHIKKIDEKTGRVLENYIHKTRNTMVRAIFTADIIKSLKPFKVDIPIDSGEVFKYTLDEMLFQRGITICKEGICKYSKKESHNTWI